MNEEHSSEESSPRDFIRDVISSDIESGKTKKLITRFPPEPNGYLHIGHAKSICLNFGVAEEFGGRCNLRLDDTNPTKEEEEYIEAIKEDVRWLGFDWGEHNYFASDYFDQLYEWAEHLIKEDKAYVDELSAEEIRVFRGTLTEPGKDSPYRDRPTEESLDLFKRMKDGEFEDGTKVLRAKIDMTSGNINLRDPVIYRILRAHHPRTGDKWCIYPMYDFAHGQSDAIEGVTHSICTLEFADHRPLYDWFIENLPVPSTPRQYEFSRLNLTNTVLSKRRLIQLVEGEHVTGWDDPRMPTISGFRRRGIPPEAIRDFAKRVGVTKSDNLVELSYLEAVAREYMNTACERRIAVLDPLKVTIENYPEDQVEEVDAVNNPTDENSSKRKVPFSRTLYIEREDFMEDAPKKFFRLTQGREVRFKYAYYLTCKDVIKDDKGEVIELICTYDPESKGGNTEDGRKVKGTIHWVSATHALDAEVRLYETLFTEESPSLGDDFLDGINPNSLTVLKNVKVEPSVANLPMGEAVQFERMGYFALDPDTKKDNLVINRAMTLRDSWAKEQKK